MKLYLVQHGDALAKEIDPDRPLSDQGRQDVDRLARFLATRGHRAARLLHSGKTRARQTAELFASAMGPGVVAEEQAGLAPNDPPRDFAESLAAWQEDAMVVGHLPFMARLVSDLVTAGDAGARVAYRPGSVVCLERDKDGAWAIAWMLRPELMG